MVRWLWVVMMLGWATGLAGTADAATSADAPSGYTTAACDDPGWEICEYDGTSTIECVGSDNADYMVVISLNNDPLAWGTVDGTAFCCDSADMDDDTHDLYVELAGGDDILCLHDTSHGSCSDALTGNQSWPTATEIYGDDGADSISTARTGGAIVDEVYGEDHIDRIWTWDGDDVVYGGAQDDYIYTHEGADTVYGGTGHDTADLGSGDDKFYGGPGDDTAYGGTGVDAMRGEDGADILYGEAGEDEICGDDGVDAINGGRDDDCVCGGSPGAGNAFDLDPDVADGSFPNPGDTYEGCETGPPSDSVSNFTTVTYTNDCTCGC